MARRIKNHDRLVMHTSVKGREDEAGRSRQGESHKVCEGERNRALRKLQTGGRMGHLQAELPDKERNEVGMG